MNFGRNRLFLPEFYKQKTLKNNKVKHLIQDDENCEKEIQRYTKRKFSYE